MRLTRLMAEVCGGKLYNFHRYWMANDHNCNHETRLWFDEERSFHRLIGTVLGGLLIWDPLPYETIGYY
jgi:hypothetical protein